MLLCSFVPLALSLALLTLIFWTCYQYPYRFLHGDRNFLERWSFIFDRFHPKTYYFALILKLGSEKTITSGGICLCKKMDGEGFWFWKRDISTLANFSKPWCLHRSPGGFVHPTSENNHDSVFKLIRVFQWWFMRIRNRIYTGPYLLGMKMQFARHMDNLNPKSQDYSQYVDCCSSGSSVHPVGPATHPKSYMFVKSPIYTRNVQGTHFWYAEYTGFGLGENWINWVWELIFSTFALCSHESWKGRDWSMIYLRST